MPFDFTWAVKDVPSYNDYTHKSSSDGKITTGTYTVVLPDGRTQIVNYKDQGYGYVADVKYEGEAKYDEYKPAYKAYTAPAYPKPAYPESVYPAKPAYPEPAYPKPTYPEPAYHKPANPAYPAYPKPAYSAYPRPAYPAYPSYPKPAYPTTTEAPAPTDE